VPYFHILLDGLTQPIIYNNEYKPILETVPADGEPEQVLEYQFKNNRFHKVLRHYIDKIHVRIVNHLFKPLPILTGETILTLEFKNGE
jgi:hypothetical protein